MPTKIRNLYLDLGDTPRAMKVIDREEEVAVSEFAPGSVRVKDKRMYEAVGFTPSLFFNPQGGWRGEGAALTRRSKLFWCSSCYFFKDYGEAAPPTDCPSCLQPVDGAPREMSFEGRIPMGYRVRNEPAPAVGESDERGSRSRAFIAVEEPGEGDDKVLGNGHIALHSSAVYRINTNSDQLYSVSDASGRESPIAQGRQSSKGPWESQVIGSETGDGPFALYCRKITDVIQIHHKELPPGIVLDPIGAGVGVSSAYYSAQQLIARAWAIQLDVAPDEMELPPIPVLSGQGATQGNRGVLILADSHANGSGLVAELFEGWAGFLSDLVHARTPMAESLWGRGSEHVQECGKACYKCLRSYRSRFIDGLLDWRLGLDLLRLLESKDYQVGLDGNFGALPSLEGWKERAEGAALRFASSFSSSGTDVKVLNDFGLPVLQVETHGFKELVIVRHPLWSGEYGPPGNILDATDSGLDPMKGEYGIQGCSSFDLTYRPTRVWSRVIRTAQGRGVSGD